MEENLEPKQYSFRIRQSQASPNASSSLPVKGSLSSASRRNTIPVRNFIKTRTKGPATLEQRRQVRYLAWHRPDLSHRQVARIVGCVDRAIPNILANKYGGGDADPDAEPEDAIFLEKYGARNDNTAENEVAVPFWQPSKMSSDVGRSVRERRLVAPEIENNHDVEMAPQPVGRDAVDTEQGNAYRDIQGDVGWVSNFFNGTDGLGLPHSVLEEMVAAGLKEHTVLYMMRKFTHKLGLANYLASVLRVSPIERDIIAGFIMERRARLPPRVKLEELDSTQT